MSSAKVRHQFGGSRKNGAEILVIPVVNGKPQVGGAFWDKAWRWAKGAAKSVAKVAKPLIKPIHDVVKASGVIGNTLSTIPGVGPVAGGIARHYGYGRQSGGMRRGDRIVRRGNAMRAAR